MRALAVGLMVTLAACEGQIVTPEASGMPAPVTPDPTISTLPDPTKPLPPQSTGWPSFGPPAGIQLRRLTTEQYLASARVLLGVSTTGMPPIEPVSPVGGFAAIGASSAVVSSNGVAQFEDAARFLAAAAFASPTAKQAITPCAPSGINDTICFRAFVTTFGRRAFRRPLASDEADRYVALITDIATSTNDPWAALEAATSAFLQSPNFLYLPELGEPDLQQPTRYRYTSSELASRLSFFLTGATPDDALLAAADSGALLTPEGLRAQTDRLLAAPQARTSMRGFFASLLALAGLDTLNRPVAIFPKFTATLGAALKEQTLLTFEDLVFDRDADYRQVFDQQDTFVNGELAGFYGLPGVSGSAFSKVSFPSSTRRPGLLGQAGVLVVHDNGGRTSPTKRGLFVLTRLLCQDLPLSPPSNLTIPPPPSGQLTARQRLEQHVANPSCAGCHKTMDAVGLSLERFDSMGVERDTEFGVTIDDSGAIEGRQYQGEAGLGTLLRNHPATGPCLTQALLGSALGHPASDFDRDTFASVAGAFEQSHGKVRSVLSAITAGDAFRYLPVPQ